MTEPTPSPADVKRSILVAVDSSAPLPLVLEAPATLASEWQARLAGMFVEDVELLRAAQLPCSFELDISTAAVRPLETAAIARELRQHAEQMRSALERQAATSRIEWTFHVSQGEIVKETLAAAAEAELFIVSRAARAYSVRGQTGSPSSPNKSETPILAVFDGSAEAVQVLSVAARLSALFRARLVVSLLASEKATPAQLRKECRQVLESGTIDAVIDDRELADVVQLLQIDRRWNSHWLVIGRHSPLLDEVRLRKIAESLGHPIALVSVPESRTAHGPSR